MNKEVVIGLKKQRRFPSPLIGFLVVALSSSTSSPFSCLHAELETKMAEEEATETSPGILQEIFTSPINISLLCLCLFLLYKIFRGDKPPDMGEIEEPLPKLKRKDFTLAELKQYDGVENPRILMAVNGKVFDVTRGKKFYGPGKADLSSVCCSGVFLLHYTNVCDTL